MNRRAFMTGLGAILATPLVADGQQAGRVYTIDLIRRKVDIILAFGAAETLAAVKATATIPVVFMGSVPVELGLVRSLARPGGNVTGLSAVVTPEIIGKQLELLKSMVSGLSRVAFLFDPERPDLQVYERAAAGGSSDTAVGGPA